MLRLFQTRCRVKVINQQWCNSRRLTGLTIGVPKESLEGEHRVAMTPAHVIKLKKSGALLRIENNAGSLSGFTDDMYKAAGAEIVSCEAVWKSQLVTKVVQTFSLRLFVL